MSKLLKFSLGISFKNFSIHIAQKKIFEIESLQIPSKGIVSILGPSGCGKSTLLRTLAGIPTMGLFYKGELKEEHKQRNGNRPNMKYSMVWQTPTVFPCTIYDNLKIPLKKNSVPKKKWISKMEHVLKKVDLLEELEAKWKVIQAKNLSGGQKQRLCIAMGLLMNSDVILMDEPTSALDPKATNTIEEILQQLSQEKLVILVTHNVGQARRISDQAIICCKNEKEVGYVCESGKTATILYQPIETETRKFLNYELGT